MYCDILSIFGILTTANLVFATTPAAAPTPAVFFEVGDNVLANGVSTEGQEVVTTFSKAHVFTFDFTGSSTQELTLALWGPPSSGLPEPATLTGDPTAAPTVSLAILFHGHK